MSALEARPNGLEAGRFVAVGVAGFAIDAGILTILLHDGQSVLLSRACSFTCASLTTWWLHRIFTFKKRRSHRQSKVAQYSRYLVVQGAGAVSNLTLFSLLVASEPRLLEWPVLPLAAGAVAGLAVNYLGSSRWAFESKSHHE